VSSHAVVSLITVTVMYVCLHCMRDFVARSLFCLCSLGDRNDVLVTDVSIDAIAALAKPKKNKMLFSTEDLVLIKVLRQKKVMTTDE